MANYIYIAENILIPGFCKLGTSVNVSNRLNGLYGDWKLYKSWQVENDKGYFYETKIKHKMREFVSHGYELFNCPISYLEKITIETIAEITEVSIPKEAVEIKFTISELSKYLKYIRKEQRLTQIELANACNISTGFIIDLEKGKETCEIGKVFHVASMLGVKLYGLLPK